MKKGNKFAAVALATLLLLGGGYIYMAAQDAEANPWVMSLCPMKSVRSAPLKEAAPKAAEEDGSVYGHGSIAEEKGKVPALAEEGGVKYTEGWSGKYVETDGMPLKEQWKIRRLTPMAFLVAFGLAAFYFNDRRLVKAKRAGREDEH